MEKITSYTDENLDTIIDGPINLTELADAIASKLDDDFCIYDSEPYLTTDSDCEDSEDSINVTINSDSTTLAPLANKIGRAIINYLKVVSV
jgi:hypothetical protein